MRSHVVMGAILLGSCAGTAAASPQEVVPAVTEMDAITVIGERPGPRMWRLTNGDNTLWILGTLTPLPLGMTWRSHEAEQVIAEADEVLAPGSARAEVSARDTFKLIFLAPAALKAVKNPQGKRLQDVLPDDLYGRWAIVRQKYFGRDTKLERYRPMFASQDLYWKATESVGLTRSNPVWDSINAMANAHGVRITGTSISYPLDLDKAKSKAGVSSLAKSDIDDVPCFRLTLDRLDSDIELMRARAVAWANGDLSALRRIQTENLVPACKNIADASLNFQERPDVTERLAATWVGAAQNALERNKVTFATLPLSEVLNPNGYISRLQSLGYALHQPDEEETEETENLQGNSTGGCSQKLTKVRAYGECTGGE